MSAVATRDCQTGNLDKYRCDRGFATRTLGNFFDSLVELILWARPTYVLNIGCGEGLDMKNIFKRANVDFAYSCGLDLRLEALKMAEKMLADSHFDAIQGDLYHLPFKLGKFDMILCLEVLEHMQRPEQLLSELSQRYSGHCLFSVPNEPCYRLTRLLLFRRNIRRFGDHPEHLNHWSTDGFIRLIRKHFTVDQVMAPFPWTAVLCHNKRP